MSTFERYLTVWVALCIVVGVGARAFLSRPGLPRIGAAEIAKVNLPVAILIWLMIIPMLVKIDFAALSQVKEHWRGIGITLFINWAVKPFSMAFLGWLFIGWLFKPYLPPDQLSSYIAGLILLAAAPCTAMVFVWSNLSDGEPHFTLSQVALNDVIMVFRSVLSQVPLNRTKCVCNCGSSARDDVCRNAAPTRLPVTRSRSSMPPLRMRVAANCSSSRSATVEASRCASRMRRSIHRDSKNGHRFGRSTLEVEEDAPISTVLCEVFPGHWVHVVTQLEEHIARDGFAGCQSQPFCSLTDPVTGLRLVLRVVIVVRQMLVEIGRRSSPVLLWFGREHGSSE